MPAAITHLFRYPVKSMGGHLLEKVLSPLEAFQETAHGHSKTRNAAV